MAEYHASPTRAAAPQDAATRPTVVTFVTRRGCHLCDDAWQTLARARAALLPEWPLEVITQDVDSDAELRAEFGEQVPVVLIDGEMHSYFELDTARFLAAVRAAGR